MFEKLKSIWRIIRNQNTTRTNSSNSYGIDEIIKGVNSSVVISSYSPLLNIGDLVTCRVISQTTEVERTGTVVFKYHLTTVRSRDPRVPRIFNVRIPQVPQVPQVSYARRKRIKEVVKEEEQVTKQKIVSAISSLQLKEE